MGKKLLLFAVLMLPAPPLGAAVLRIEEEAPGLYRIEGEELNGVASLDLNIAYDASKLAITRVNQGPLVQGMLFAANPHQSGQVRIGVVGTHAISGAGTLAIISGTVKDTPLVFLGFTAKLSDALGRPVSVRTELPKSHLNTPADPMEHEKVTDRLPSSVSLNRPGFAPVVKIDIPAPLSMWEAEVPSAVAKAEPYKSPLPDNSESRQTSRLKKRTSSAPFINKQEFSAPCVLELFEQYEGPRMLPKLTSLFFVETEKGIQQRPGLLMADGEATLEIVLPVSGRDPYSIALIGARLLWTGFDDGQNVIVRCIPRKGVISAKMVLLSKEEVVSVPLTVAPLISMAGIEFQAGKPLPKLDLNADGESNWMDDYILVANILHRDPEVKDRVRGKN